MEDTQETIRLNKQMFSIIEQENDVAIFANFLKEHEGRIGINSENIIGTPIFEAAMLGKWDYVKLLYNAGANIDVAHSSNKWSFFHEVILNAPDNIWQAILEDLKEDNLTHTIRQKEKTLGYTPLMLAYVKRRDDRFMDLMKITDKHFGLMEKNNNSDLLTHLACLNNDMEAVQLLVDRNCPFNLRNKSSKMAFELTTSSDILELLVSKGLTNEWIAFNANEQIQTKEYEIKEEARILPRLVRM